jgi:HAD superfamily phosphatase (TIGR01681 family)
MPKLVIFDLDGTLWHDDSEMMCKDTKFILKHLRSQGHTLAISSYNPEAETIISKLGIEDFFVEVIGGFTDCCTKIPHVKDILQSTGMSKNQVIFFDDFITNVRELQRWGISAHLVDERTGVTIHDIIAVDL